MPKLVRVHPQKTTAVMPPGTAEDFGGNQAQQSVIAGRGALQAGVAAGDAIAYKQFVDTRLEHAEQETSGAFATAEIEAKLGQLRQSFDGDPDYKTQPERFEKGAADIVKEAEEAFPLSGQHKTDLGLRTFQLLTQHRLALGDEVRKRTIDSAKGKMIQTREALRDAITAEADPRRQQFLRDMYVDDVNRMRDGELMTHEEAAKEIETWRDGLDKDVAAINLIRDAQAVEDMAFTELGADASDDDLEAYVRAVSDGKTRDEALKRVRLRASTNERSKVERRKANTSAIANHTRSLFAGEVQTPDGQTLVPTPENVTRWRDELRAMVVDADLSFEDGGKALQLFDTLAAGEPIRTNLGLYNRLMKDPGLAAREGMTELDLSLELKTGELKDVMTKVREFEQGGIIAKDILDEEIDDALLGQEIDDDDAQGTIRAQIRAQVRAEQQTGPVMPPRRLEIINDVVDRYTGSDPWGPGGSSLPVAHRARIKAVAEQNPNVAGLAMWTATAQGTVDASDGEVVAQMDALLKLVKDAQASGTADDVRAITNHINRFGSHARASLAEIKYRDTDILQAEQLLENKKRRDRARRMTDTSLRAQP